MGAWAADSFGNDDALDWLQELDGSDDLSPVEEALNAVVGAEDYLEAPECSMAIAAAKPAKSSPRSPCRPGSTARTTRRLSPRAFSVFFVLREAVALKESGISPVDLNKAAEVLLARLLRVLVSAQVHGWREFEEHRAVPRSNAARRRSSSRDTSHEAWR